VLAAALASCIACGDAGVEGEDPAVTRGRDVYLPICTACHNADPSREGSQGPAVAGSSLELLRARVLGRGYPPGYTPKRNSNLMPAFPQLAEHLEDLHAFLNTKPPG
jgi:mono/diheme cytochrome c family protein